MRKLIVERTSNSPEVRFDPDENRFAISGESRPPNVPAFYDEIINWLAEFSHHLSNNNEKKGPFEFSLDFEYFNSSSAKYLLDFCKQLSSLYAKGENILVKWIYEPDDVDMLEVGKEMSRIAKMPFEFVIKNPDSRQE